MADPRDGREVGRGKAEKKGKKERTMEGTRKVGDRAATKKRYPREQKAKGGNVLLSNEEATA